MWNKTRMLTLTIFVQHGTGSLNHSNEARERKGIQIGKEKIKPSLFTEDTILYIGNLKELHVKTRNFETTIKKKEMLQDMEGKEFLGQKNRLMGSHHNKELLHSKGTINTEDTTHSMGAAICNLHN